ncbi:MAG TPA: response regulator transcription factor [Candidatus Sulfotelmatobacter sp.]|nr:response regulator transcription factor [Candidatus Sulfotelmatobacter sp.]
MLCERVLVVDDDAASRHVLSRSLASEGFSVIEAISGEDLHDEWLSGLCVAIINANRKGSDRFDMVKRFSSRWPMVGLVLLMDQAGPEDRALGFELGADDFMQKPVDPRELQARIRSFMRRMRLISEGQLPGRAHNGAIEFGGWALDATTHSLKSPEGEAVDLTTTETNILTVLAGRPGAPVSRQVLYKAVRGREWSPLDRSLDTHVANLRRKLNRLGGDRLITTVHGQGYSLAAH